MPPALLLVFTQLTFDYSDQQCCCHWSVPGQEPWLCGSDCQKPRYDTIQWDFARIPSLERKFNNTRAQILINATLLALIDAREAVLNQTGFHRMPQALACRLDIKLNALLEEVGTFYANIMIP